jgi:hypothetical protein
MKIEANFFENLYLKAKKSFNACILNPDNDYLKDEINIPINEIILVEEFIRIQFFKYDIEKFVVEVKLKLISHDDHIIGSYLYWEDEKNTPLDDSLIFE